MPFANVGTEEAPVRIFYNLFGNGPKKVLLITGFATGHKAWTYTLNELLKNEEYQYCALDNRGCGQSDYPLERYTTSLMAHDALKLIDSLGPEWNTPHIVGVSMGGMISQELTLAMLELNRKPLSLTLVVTHAGRVVGPISGAWALFSTIFKKTPEERAPLVLGALHNKEFLESVHTDGRTKAEWITEGYLNRVKSDPPSQFSGFIGHVCAVTTHYVSEERLNLIKEASIPTLIITGTEDQLVHHSNSYYLNEKLSPVEFVVWEGVGHGVLYERFDEFNSALFRNWERAYQSKEEFEKGEIAKGSKKIEITD